MSDPSDERVRATGILRSRTSPLERGLAGGRLEMTPPSEQNPERVRRGLEETRREEAEIERLVLRALNEQRVRSMLELRPPVFIAARLGTVQVLVRLVGKLRNFIAPISPGADMVMGTLESLYTAATGTQLQYDLDAEPVDVSTLERFLAGLDIALLVLPAAGKLVRSGGRAAVLLARETRVSVAEANEMLQVLHRFGSHQVAMADAVAALRRGRRLTAGQFRVLRQFEEAWRRRSVSRASVRSVEETVEALRRNQAAFEQRGIVTRAKPRVPPLPRQTGTAGPPRAARRRNPNLPQVGRRRRRASTGGGASQGLAGPVHRPTPMGQGAPPEVGPLVGVNVRPLPPRILTGDTARTGGIVRIRAAELLDEGRAVLCRIEGWIFRSPAGRSSRLRNFNKNDAGLRAPSQLSVEGVSLRDYQYSHLFGPRWSDEARDGLMLAPDTLNQVWQNHGVEAFIDSIALAAQQRGGRIFVIGTAKSFPRARMRGLRGREFLLREVEYEIQVYIPGENTGLETVLRVSVEIDHPVAGSRVHAPVIQRATAYHRLFGH